MTPDQFLAFAERHGCKISVTGAGGTSRISYAGHDIGYVNQKIRSLGALYGYKFRIDRPSDGYREPDEDKYRAYLTEKYGTIPQDCFYPGQGSNAGRTFLAIKGPELAAHILGVDISELSAGSPAATPSNIHPPGSELDQAVSEALSRSTAERAIRLAMAGKLPEVRTVERKEFLRNPDVIAHVRLRAAGVCERCGMKAPFIAASDGQPYLEVHHNVRLADGGEDSVENAVALCPNCHRFMHYGSF